MTSIDTSKAKGLDRARQLKYRRRVTPHYEHCPRGSLCPISIIVLIIWWPSILSRAFVGQCWKLTFEHHLGIGI